ncbi:MAG: phosphoserine transaminase [Alphaproteobacteria bacterium]|nr:MAG: phosphoserine transaminase [Alphaproteobacteria bacterium]
MEKPNTKPNNPNFSSGPCAKRPGWSLNTLSGAALGRSHRSAIGKSKLKQVIELHRELLNIPQDYKIGIVPASDTGAFEMAMWSMLGQRGVDVLSWESFGAGWASDIKTHLQCDNVNHYDAPYGDLPDLSTVNSDNDIVFTWNGTTSGVRVPNGDWIPDTRTGLTLCDATSAVFAYDMPWDKLDVTTWSWQKVLGSEGAHGMIVLSPRAVERLESFTPDNRPLPKIFRMTKKGAIIDGIFTGATINTPSMLAVEDCLDALNWVKNIGGSSATIKRSQNNFNAVNEWVSSTDWVDFLSTDKATCSTTSICLTLKTPKESDAKSFIKSMVTLLDDEGIAYDINAYRDAPAGLRIWGGATIETSDIQALLPWIEWAYHKTMNAI